ncbi:glycoside hydrolase N-terminal domain-containing protein [Candidatus Sumerlaeota bacterium]|nr:glycoside hydrolase N-terminal domain-containing protein [Candidatus Sumerlaeota bacterium]
MKRDKDKQTFLESPRRGFVSRRPARTWEEALAVGNGTMGALVMSQPKEETLILSHERFFFPRSSHVGPVHLAPHLPHIRQFLAEGRCGDAARFAYDEAVRQGMPEENLLPNAFHPAFDLLVGMGPQGGVRDYSRALDFETGEAIVRWTNQRGRFERRVFVSRADNAIVVGIRSLDGIPTDCTLMFNARPAERDRFGSDRRFASGIRSVEIAAEGEWLTYRSAYAVAPKGYEGVGRVATRGGTIANQGNVVCVEDADEVLVPIRIVPLDDARESRVEETKRSLSSLPQDYDALLERHAAIHGEIFRRVSLELDSGELGSGEDRDLPSEELVERASRGDVSPAFLEKAFDAGRYMVLSSSGEWPPNLQGVWTGIWAPPWGGNYTLDANVQAALSPALVCDMPECLESLFRLVESLLPDWRTNAERVFGCRGVVSCAATTGDSGLVPGFNVGWPLVFWTAGAGWLANAFLDYWLVTGDRDFLARRLAPLLKEIALFYEDFLVEDETGRYLFSPSYSPENTPSNGDSQVAINATMDIAVAKEVLANLASACETLGIESEGVARWRAMIAKMPEYLTNEDGALKEWTHPDLADQYEHRHVCHLYPAYPGLEADEYANPALCAALRRAAELRLAQDPKIQKGFGLYHLSMACSRLGCPDLAWRALRQMAEEHYYPNFATAHNYGRDIFNLDASGGFPSALVEMLVASRPGRIDLLPGLPDEFEPGTLRGVLCRGRIRIEELAWIGKPVSKVRATLRSETDQTVTIRLPREIAAIRADGDPARAGESRLGVNCREVRLTAGRNVVLEIDLRS